MPKFILNQFFFLAVSILNHSKKNHRFSVTSSTLKSNCWLLFFIQLNRQELNKCLPCSYLHQNAITDVVKYQKSVFYKMALEEFCNTFTLFDKKCRIFKLCFRSFSFLKLKSTVTLYQFSYCQQFRLFCQLSYH